MGLDHHSIGMELSSGVSRRIFWAVPLDDALRTYISAACGRMKKDMPFRTWTHPHDYHITLIFLGEMADHSIPAILEAARDAVVRHEPFQLCLSAPGTFGGGGKSAPRVLWFGVSGQTDQLANLQRDLSSALVPLGYRPESRPFTPHITVARRGVRPLADGKLPRDVLSLSPGEEALNMCWDVQRIVLYESLLGQSPMYKELAALPLGRG